MTKGSDPFVTSQKAKDFLKEWDASEYLETEEDIAAYLNWFKRVTERETPFRSATGGVECNRRAKRPSWYSGTRDMIILYLATAAIKEIFIFFNKKSLALMAKPSHPARFPRLDE